MKITYVLKPFVRTLVYAILTVASVGYAGEGIVLQSNDISVIAVKADKVEIESLAPDAPATRVTLIYQGLGCSDRLGPVNYKILTNSGTAKKPQTLVFVSSHVIVNEKSSQVKCLRAPVWKAEFILPKLSNVVVYQSDSEPDNIVTE